MLDIEDLNYAELKVARDQLAEREREMERAALYTLQHRPLRHAGRLVLAALGFKITEPTEHLDELTDEEPQTAAA